jgi:hypothetical protein
MMSGSGVRTGGRLNRVARHPNRHARTLNRIFPALNRDSANRFDFDRRAGTSSRGAGKAFRRSGAAPPTFFPFFNTPAAA